MISPPKVNLIIHKHHTKYINIAPVYDSSNSLKKLSCDVLDVKVALTTIKSLLGDPDVAQSTPGMGHDSPSDRISPMGTYKVTGAAISKRRIIGLHPILRRHRCVETNICRGIRCPLTYFQPHRVDGESHSLLVLSAANSFRFLVQIYHQRSPQPFNEMVEQLL